MPWFGGNMSLLLEILVSWLVLELSERKAEL